jgi:nicotinate-nucleotide pyrophosphorylase (carboxylating)
MPTFDDADARAADRLIDLALDEDLRDVGDLTCQALVEDDQTAEIDVVAREAGVLAGAVVAERVFAKLDGAVAWRTRIADGGELAPGSVIATVAGPLGSLLIGERTALNFLGHLSGVASLVRRFVDRIAGTRAVLLDTRKTLPGYRLLQKYAVRCGGGTNHRMGLHDGVLIKDNHLAAWAARHGSGRVADAVARSREVHGPDLVIEVEVDSLGQFEDALRESPGIVLLDNFPLADLRTAVAIRDERAPDVRLEASGGVTLETIGDVARTGVDRISVGTLTHSARNLDIGFDWHTQPV